MQIKMLPVQFTQLAMMLVTLLVSQGIQAHAEHDKTRFVAMNGHDSGLCNNRFRPCQTVSYAAQQAAKGDRILVAQGQYQIKSAEDLLYFSGEIVPVSGGYDQLDQYQHQNPDAFVTSVSGVPAEYVHSFSQRGFHLIRDAKAQTMAKSAANEAFSALALMQQGQATSECLDGDAAGFACQNVSLLAHIPLNQFAGSPTSANDIWGHIDLNNGREYAIIGLRNGIAVVDVSDAQHPVIIGSIAGQPTSWRDIKVWQFFDVPGNRWRAYAYATADNTSEGLSIIDLSGLPQNIALVQKQTIDASAHNVYISNIDYGLNIANSSATPLLHISGSNRSNGAFRSYQLSTPENISLSYQALNPTASDYTHDTSSVLLNDSRAQTQCQHATAAGCTVLFDFNERTVRLWDHSQDGQVVALSETNYPLAEYTHSGWWTEDKAYLLVHDELDEQTHGINTTLNIFDISNLSQPLLVGTWRGPTRAIDHNGFVRGNHYFMSNYERGLTILDISQPASPQQIGFFDTYPVSDNAAFNGAWGVYPFLPSGNILVSDINSGLFVLGDQTRVMQPEQLAFDLPESRLSEGETGRIAVNKSGTKPAAVFYQIINGSADDNDYVIDQGMLSWSVDDNAPQFIEISIKQDDVEEPDELLFIRLVNPQNAAVLAYPNLHKLTIDGVTQRGKISFAQNELVLKETDAKATINIERLAGSSGSITVNYYLQSDSATVGQDVTDIGGSLSWQEGETGTKQIELLIIDDSVSETNESFRLKLEADDMNLLSAISSLTVTLLDDESNQAPIVNVTAPAEVNPRQQTQLNGNASDPEGRQLSYLWQQLTGPAVEIQFADSANASFIAPFSASSLQFSLTATDDFGLAGSATISISVISPPPASSSTSGGGGTVNLLSLLLLLLFHYALRKVPQPSHKH